ncbi:MAG: PVC-type heme-binding CxxCH protein [Rhodothermales bacterium]|nr:PVC-type heme-binding CxxCH protein [Rhodothermales bacterium]
MLRLTAILIFLLPACQPAPSGTGGLSPEDALASFQVADGFQIERVAAEPNVMDPVAMEIDERGRLFVVEMPGYPMDISANGRIRRIEDTNGDGLPDASRIFADSLVLPTGIMRWKNGYLVTAPPDLIYFEDTDDDGRADRREVILTGFSRSNPQSHFNKPYFGLDNWIYLANNGSTDTDDYGDLFGDKGSEVYFPARPDGVRLGKNGDDRNVRFKPDTHALESLSSRSQFGQAFDDWGRHFAVSNAHPQYHEVIARRYISRNPLMPVQLSMHYTPAYGRNTAIYPITDNPEHQLLTDRGMVTSAAGITVYQADLFPPAYQNVSFIGEPVHNLVHALRMVENGPTFRSERLEERKEFLASRDSWFRPVNFYMGPDGALYVVDYYRQIVEHPEWMDDAAIAAGILYNGNDRGRIYRIVPTGTPQPAWLDRLDLGAATTDELVGHLANPNIWWRRNAQRLLLDRADPAAESALIALAAGPSALGRLHALWTLDGLGKLTPIRIEAALRDAEAGVRENAIILAEQRLEAHPEMLARLESMESDPNARVRFQLLCTLGFFDTPESRRIRQRMLTRDMDDPWMQVAALSAPDQIDDAYIARALATAGKTTSTGRATYLERIGYLAAAGKDKALFATLTARLSRPSSGITTWQKAALLRGLAQGTPRDDAYAAAAAPIVTAFTASTDETERAAYLALLDKTGLPASNALSSAVTAGIKSATDTRRTPALRAQDIRLLAMNDPNAHREAMQALIVPAEQPLVQEAAVSALQKADDAGVADFLLGRWPELTPAVRDAALDVLMETPDRAARLLDAVEAGTIQRSTIGWDRTVKLMRDWEGPVKDRARSILSEQPGEREQIVATYMASLDGQGDVAAGQAAFEVVCGTCHQVAGEHGEAFGPDLATVRHWSPEALVAKILMPGRSLADGYEVWTVEHTSGEKTTGLLAADSPSSLTLRTLARQDVTIARADVASMQNLNQTLMPTGLEAALNPQQMVDLIAFLRFN